MDAIKTGALIRALRTERGLTQAQLGKELHVTNKAVSKWENGHGLPEITYLQALSMFFGVTVNELLAGERLESETDYRDKAEENLTVLMKPHATEMLLSHFLVSGLLAVVCFGVMCLAAEQLVDPIAMPMVFFWVTLMVTVNLAAGLTYGVLKKWGLWRLTGMVLFDTAILVTLITLLQIMFVVF